MEKQSEDGRYSANGYNVYCNLDALTATLQRVFRNKAIPGQPTTSNGKPYKDLFYSVLKVNVDDIDNMIAVQEQIQALGYEASSNIEWIESTQKQYANIQAMLGGIGAISLLVAAIGITLSLIHIFGGSSLASAQQFEKVAEIVHAEASRRYVVPSAPGKRFRKDTKVTDMLYGCCLLYTSRCV